MTTEREAASAAISATVTSSRALLGIVAQSLAQVLDELTIGQFRVLVVLEGSGPVRMGELAERVGVHPSTLSRTVDRLASGEWIERGASPESRREVIVSLAERGSALVADVTRKRRRSIAAVLRELPDAERAEVRRGMELFARAAGEPASDDLLALGL